MSLSPPPFQSNYESGAKLVPNTSNMPVRCRFAPLALVVVVAIVGALPAKAIRLTLDCENLDRNTPECIEIKRANPSPLIIHPEVERDKEVADLVRLFSDFEETSNEFACTVSGFALYEIPQEKQQFDNMLKLLAAAFKLKGQLYAAAITKYVIKKVRTPDRMRATPYLCDNIPFRDAKRYNYPIQALVAMKDALSKWIISNEAEHNEIVDFFITNSRRIYGRWALSRVNTINKNAPHNDQVTPEEVALGILPLIDQEKNAEGKCDAGGDLFFTYASNAEQRSSAPRLAPKIDALIEHCYVYGRTAKKPTTYGKVLLRVGQVEKARELFEVAVQRGQLCNAYQRPEMHHRKDITAQPVWTLEQYPQSLRKAIYGIQDPLYKAIELKRFPYSGDTESFSLFTIDGAWERTLLYGRYGGNSTLCAKMGDELCKAIENLADAVTEANDAYSFACNRTLIMNLWRVQPGASTRAGVGSLNFLHQLIMPIYAKGTAVVAQVGEEVVKAREGDIIIVDDTFENRISIVDEESSDPRLSEPRELLTSSVLSEESLTPLPTNFDLAKGTVIFQMQICHPEMHEKAMEVEGKFCKGTKEEADFLERTKEEDMKRAEKKRNEMRERDATRDRGSRG